MAALALEFAILTAARSGEVRGATWSEIELTGKLWTVPAERMKAGRLHRVPLCERAVVILESLKVLSGGSALVFPTPKPGVALSDAAFSALLKRMGKVPGTLTPHGFRSSFRDWAGEVSRLTTAVSDRDAGKLTEATARALQIGLPFNRFTTVHWEAAGVSDDLKATARLLKLMAGWLRSRGHQAAFVWVRENGHGKGAHVHILLHVRPELVDAFNRRQRGWLTACEARWRRGVLKGEPIARSYRQALGGGRDYLENLSQTVDYVLKGADRRTRERFGIRHSQDGGPVVGKRCGISQNLGPAAQDAALKIQANAETSGKSGGDRGRL